MTVFWEVALLSLIEVYWCFRGAYCLHLQGYDNGFIYSLFNDIFSISNYTALNKMTVSNELERMWKEASVA
jgi:hypothetical protein